MDLIRDYLYYHSGNECPKIYHLWSCLSMISAVSGRRVYFLRDAVDAYEQMMLYTDQYCCLVGHQGSRKSFAKDSIRDLIIELFPSNNETMSGIPLCAEIQSHQDILKRLGDDDKTLRCYKDENDITIETHPMYLLVDELVNFLAINPAGMVGFMTGIYGRKYYDASTKNKGTDIIVNPNINVLACATTEFITDQLRARILSGGLARRMVFVHSPDEFIRIPNPKVPEGGRDKLSKVKDHLKSITTIVGPYKWESSHSADLYDKWYKGVILPVEPLMAGFCRSMPNIVLKLTMCHDLASYSPKRLLTNEHFEVAKATVEATMPYMEQLFLASGRNELAVPQQKLLEMMDRIGGIVPEKTIFKFDSDMNPREIMMVLEHLQKSERVTKVRVNNKWCYVTEHALGKGMKDGTIEQKNGQYERRVKPA